MEGLRDQSEDKWLDEHVFLEDTEAVYLLHVTSDATSQPAWQKLDRAAALGLTEHEPTDDSCILVWIVLNEKTKEPLCDQNLFERAFEACRIDPYLRSYSARVLPQFLRIPGKDVTTYQVKPNAEEIIWTYDAVHKIVRGLVFSIGAPEGREFSGILSYHYTHLAKELGLVWITILNSLKIIESDLSDYSDTIIEVSVGTEHAPDWEFPYAPEWEQDEDVPQIDKLTFFMKEMASAAADLAYAGMWVRNMRSMLAEMQKPGHQGFDDAEDSTAFAIVEARITAASVLAEYLTERARTQMSVLTSLITREDTKASIVLTASNLEVAKAAKHDSNAMKTISIVTMAFLPATFLATVFSMPLLRWGNKPVIASQFWIYWAFSIPITLLVFLVWSLLNFRSTIVSILQSGTRRSKAGSLVAKSTASDVESSAQGSMRSGSAVSVPPPVRSGINRLDDKAAERKSTKGATLSRPSRQNTGMSEKLKV